MQNCLQLIYKYKKQTKKNIKVTRKNDNYVLFILVFLVFIFLQAFTIE